MEMADFSCVEEKVEIRIRLVKSQNAVADELVVPQLNCATQLPRVWGP